MFIIGYTTIDGKRLFLHESTPTTVSFDWKYLGAKIFMTRDDAEQSVDMKRMLAVSRTAQVFAMADFRAPR